MNELTKLLGDPIEGNEYIIKPINGEFWIEHKHVGSGEPLGQFLNKIWNAAIDAAAEGAELARDAGQDLNGIYVDKQSILNLKIKT